MLACSVFFSVRMDRNVFKSDAIFCPPWTELHVHMSMWINNSKFDVMLHPY